MRKGFTLLELLLVVAILAILAAAIGPSFYERGQISMEYARKSKFINNYNAINLAANVFLLASDTRAMLNTTWATNAGTVLTVTAVPSNGGLSVLVASNTIQYDTCTYENFRGETRYFAMGASSPAGIGLGFGTYGTHLSSTKTPYTEIVGTTFVTTNSIEKFLKSGKTVGDLWEEIKTK